MSAPGTSRSFNDLARAVIAAHGSGRIEYIPMPADLAAAYQAFTEADISRLRRDGYAADFLPIEDGVRRTLGDSGGSIRSERAELREQDRPQDPRKSEARPLDLQGSG